MSTIAQPVQDYFAKLGFPPEICEIYVALQMYGPQHISQLARSTHIERTRIYRLLPLLKSSQLIEIELRQNREILKAAPIANLHVSLSKKEEELRELQSQFGQISTILQQNENSSAQTRVQFYQGVDGNKQMHWNETRAKNEVLCILFDNMQHNTGQAFFKRWVRKNNELGIHHRGILGSQFMDRQRQWYSINQNERLHHWQQRQIAESVLPITHSTVTYNNVVAYYNWSADNIFGIEIYNQDIANTQRHLFELLWNQAVTVEDVAESVS